MPNRIRRLIILLVLFAAIIGTVIMLIIYNQSPAIKIFEVSEYQYYIEECTSEESLGPVLDVKDLLKKVEEIWIKIYGEHIKSQKPFQVFYDEKNGIWLVRGTLRSNMDGGVANILVENDTGNVLAVWHEK